jgi:hypothetical protein
MEHHHLLRRFASISFSIHIHFHPTFIPDRHLATAVDRLNLHPHPGKK